MSTVSVLSLTNPKAVPAAADARLKATALALTSASTSKNAGVYAGWLARSASVSSKARSLLAAAVAGTATEADAGGLVAAERVFFAGMRLFEELAKQTVRRDRVAAMEWSTLHRRAFSDVSLTRKEHARNALAGANLAITSAPIRILPGAEYAVTMLSKDFLVFAGSWDLGEFAADMASYVVVS